MDGEAAQPVERYATKTANGWDEDRGRGISLKMVRLTLFAGQCIRMLDGPTRHVTVSCASARCAFWPIALEEAVDGRKKRIRRFHIRKVTDAFKL